jgi:uncharacterized membrane protein YeaQ/YmgE (transglycosylase-associated protein family)
MNHYHDLDHIIWFLVIGGLAGWIASLLVEGEGMGIVADIIVGIFGAFMGGWLIDFFGINVGGFWGGFFMWVLGAVVLLVIFRGVRRIVTGK